MKTLRDLPSLKEEHVPVLAEMGIESLLDLREAIADPAAAKGVMGALKGVGPKTVEKWVELLAELEEEEEEAVIVEDEESEDEDAILEEGEYVAKAKPELDDETVAKLRQRREVSDRRPAFKRQEWFRYSKLGEKWRRPKGRHSKMREAWGRRPPLVSIGFRGPKDVRGLHSSGFEEVLVHNISQLESLDPKTQAARVGGTVGMRKRIDIEDRADELGIRVLNRMG